MPSKIPLDQSPNQGRFGTNPLAPIANCQTRDEVITRIDLLVYRRASRILYPLNAGGDDLIAAMVGVGGMPTDPKHHAQLESVDLLNDPIERLYWPVSTPAQYADEIATTVSRYERSLSRQL